MVQLKQPVSSTSSATDTAAVLCSVEQVDTTLLIADVKDQTGTYRKVSIQVLPGKPTAYPAVGETWLISREFGDWMFVAAINVKPPDLVILDAAGRAQVEDPVAAKDIVNLEFLQSALPVIPAGVVWQWAGGTAPTGWLLCSGQSVLKATYPALNTVLSAAGYPYGSASTTFTLPDFTDRFPRGNTLTPVGGSDLHDHASASHAHTLSSAGQAQISGTSTLIGGVNVGGVGGYTQSYRSTTTSTTAGSTTSATPLQGSTDTAFPGNTGFSNNIPVFTGIKFIIKT